MTHLNQIITLAICLFTFQLGFSQQSTNSSSERKQNPVYTQETEQQPQATTPDRVRRPDTSAPNTDTTRIYQPIRVMKPEQEH